MGESRPPHPFHANEEPDRLEQLRAELDRIQAEIYAELARRAPPPRRRFEVITGGSVVGLALASAAWLRHHVATVGVVTAAGLVLTLPWSTPDVSVPIEPSPTQIAEPPPVRPSPLEPEPEPPTEPDTGPDSEQDTPSPEIQDSAPSPAPPPQAQQDTSTATAMSPPSAEPEPRGEPPGRPEPPSEEESSEEPPDDPEPPRRCLEVDVPPQVELPTCIATVADVLP